MVSDMARNLTPNLFLSFHLSPGGNWNTRTFDGLCREGEKTKMEEWKKIQQMFESLPISWKSWLARIDNRQLVTPTCRCAVSHPLTSRPKWRRFTVGTVDFPLILFQALSFAHARVLSYIIWQKKIRPLTSLHATTLKNDTWSIIPLNNIFLIFFKLIN